MDRLPSLRRPTGRATSSKLLKVLLCAALAVTLIPAVAADAGVNSWSPTGGPTGTDMAKFETFPSGVLAAALWDGVYWSGDAGATWSEFGLGFSPAIQWCMDVAVSQTATYFAATDNGVYYVRGVGGLWELAGTGTQGQSMSSVVVAEDGTIIAGRSGAAAGIYRSTNGGATWSTASGNIPATVWCLGATDATIVAGTLSDGIWASSDEGETWARAGTGIPTTAQVSGVAFTETAWFAATDAGLFRSTNTGATWSVVKSGTYTDVAVEVGGAIDAAFWGYGVVRSADGGDTWSWTGDSQACHWPDSLACIGYTVLAGYRGPGVYRTTLAGTAPWVQSNTGLPELSCRRVAFGLNGEMLVGADASGGESAGLYKSTNNGATWQLADFDLGGATVYDMVTSPIGGDLYVASSMGAYETTDGADYAEVSGGFPGGTTTCIAISPDGGTLAVAGYGFVAKKLTSDTSWTPVTTTGLPNSATYSVEIAADGSLLIGKGDALYRLPFGETSWTKISTFDGVIYDLARRNDGRLYASGSMSSTSTAMFKSADNGASWSPLGFTGDVRSVAVIPYGNFMFACRMNDGVYRSIDDGASWQLARTGDAQALNVATASAFGPLLMGTQSGASVYEFVTPTVSMAVTPTSPAAVNGWYKGPRTIVLNRPVAAVTYYRVDSGSTYSTSAATMSFPAVEGSHTITYYGSTWGVAQSGVHDIVRVDSTAPSGTMKLEGGAAQSSKLTVSIDSAVTDTAGSGVADMRVWVNGGWGAWKPYVAKTYVMLPGYDGTKTVKVEYRDEVGNVTQRTDTILYLRPKAIVSTPVLTPTSPTHGVSFALRGTVAPKVYGSDKVFVYRKNAAGGWSYWGTYFAPNTASGSGSAYSASMKLGKAGSYRLRVYYPGSSTVAPNTSAWRYFTVK